MATLSEVYSLIKGLQERNIPIPDSLQKEAEELEVALLNEEVATAMRQHIQPLFDKIQSKFVLVCEHTPGSPMKLSITRETDIVSLLDDAVAITDHETEASADDVQETAASVVAESEPTGYASKVEDEEADDEEVSTPQTGKAKSIGFTVRFADGHVVANVDAKKTMVDALRYMGLEKVARFVGRRFKGYALVDRRQRTDKGREGKDVKWQEPVENGWYVYINMPNDTKKAMLQSVADFLGLTITIMDNEDKSISPSLPFAEKEKGRRAMFSFNGKPALDKRNSVLAVVRQFVSNRPNATYLEIHRSFPDNLQGSYGVIKTIDEINEKRSKGQQVDNRYFLDPKDLLTSADGVQFAVSNQWGDQFYQFQNHIRNFGWTLKEVE